MKGMWTDHSLGQPLENGATTVAVGRLPARTIKQARQMVTKLVSFESKSAKENRISLLVGDPGGPTALQRFVAGAIIKSAVDNRLAKLPTVTS